jgi:hypothetical protein
MQCANDEPKVVHVRPLPVLAVDVDRAAAMFQMSGRMWRKLSAAGRIGPVGSKLGKLRRYPLTELAAWAEAGMPSRAEWMARGTDQ